MLKFMNFKSENESEKNLLLNLQAIMEQRTQKQELEDFQRMRELEQRRVDRQANAVKSNNINNHVNLYSNLAENKTHLNGIKGHVDTQLPNFDESRCSSRNSFTSAASMFNRKNIVHEKPGNKDSIPQISSPFSDTIDDFQSTCASPTQLHRNLNRVATEIPHQNGTQPGLLKIAMPQAQTVPANTNYKPDQPAFRQEYVQPNPMPGNNWPNQALHNPIVGTQTGGPWAPIGTQPPIPSGPWMNNINEQPRIQQPINPPWEPSQQQSNMGYIQKPIPIGGQRDMDSASKYGYRISPWMDQSNLHPEHGQQYTDSLIRRQSQPHLVPYGDNPISWNLEQQSTNLRRAYSQTLLSRPTNQLWNQQENNSLLNTLSMNRSSSKLSVMSDGQQAGWTPSLTELDRLRASPRSYNSFAKSGYNDDDDDDRNFGWTSKNVRTLPRSMVPGDQRIEKEHAREKKLRRRDYYLSMEELVQKRKQDSLKQQGFELVKYLREAGKLNFTAEDLQVALNHCGSKQNPVQWLKDNWKNMVETVVTLATNYGHDKRDNDVGILSSDEAKVALRLHLGNVWAAVTECVESRQKKVMELLARGEFGKKEAAVALSSNHGDIEAAFEELTKSETQPFEMNIWGAGSGTDNKEGAMKEQNSDEEYKPALSTFSMFSTPVSLKGLQSNQKEGIPKDIQKFIEKNIGYMDVKKESDLEDISSDEHEDETITQWLIRDSCRPRVDVQINEAKKLKSAEMIRAAMSVNVPSTSKGVVKDPKVKMNLDKNIEENAEAIKDEERKDSGKVIKENLDLKVYEEEKVKLVPKEKDVIAAGKKKVNKSEQERKARMLLAEGKCDNYEQAETAAKLLDLMFTEEQSLMASKECGDVYQALNYLHQDCELCVAQYPAADMVSMVHCTHRACQTCAKTYFTLQIRDRNIMEAKCPFCDEPDLTNEDVAQDYFNHLERLLKTLVDDKTYELFQRKLRDRVLMDDPNFKWCSQCSSGFIANLNLKKLVCPDCRNIMCGKCLVKWEDQHEQLTCEKFKEWKESNDPDHQAVGVEKHLEEHGIQCPKCKFKFSLARGGCMHYKCTQCQFEFCSGCGKPFKMGAKCGKAAICARLGLHAHHPRNCLFYLRDKELEDLRKLLKEHKIDYKTNGEEDEGDVVKCKVVEQKETDEGLKDESCNKEVEDAGYCRAHYIEYLGGLINKNNVDPVILMNEDELELILKRAEVRLPLRPWREKPDQYRNKLIHRIEEVLPLEKEITA